jgi:hypothetical protein
MPVTVNGPAGEVICRCRSDVGLFNNKIFGSYAVELVGTEFCGMLGCSLENGFFLILFRA